MAPAVIAVLVCVRSSPMGRSLQGSG